jgi:hypothetical protein
VVLQKRLLGRKEKHLRSGRCPENSLKMARGMRLEARRALELGNDPGIDQEAERLRSTTCKTIATERMELQPDRFTPKTWDHKLERFRVFVFPYIGERPIVTIKALDVSEAPAHPVEARPALEGSFRKLDTSPRINELDSSAHSTRGANSLFRQS